jgi:hypothetical protein
MQVDNLTRALLAGILAFLLILLVQGCSRGSADGDLATAGSPVPERFSLRPVNLQRGPPLLLRHDTATGEAWRMGLMDKGRWEALAEGPDGVPSPGATAPGRYSIRPISQKRGAPTLVRSDRLTGRVWRKGSKSDGPWVLVPNPGDEAPAEEPAEEAAAEAAAP